MNYFETLHYSVLLVEAVSNGQALEDILVETRLNISVTRAVSVSGANEALESGEEYNFVLLDYELGEMTAQHVLANMAHHDNQIPVVVVSSQTDPNLGLELLESGATDYILREDCSPPRLRKLILFSYVRHHHHSTYIRYQNTIAALAHQKEIELAIRREHEILKDTNQRLSYIALHDGLTGLANRALMLEHLQHAIELSVRNKLVSAIFFLDLDGFKQVNDTYGHDIGDLLLIEVTRRVQNRLRASDLMARLGGDEFVVIVESVKNKKNAAKFAADILDQLNQPFKLKGITANVSCSIGVSFFPQQETDMTGLIKQADLALYKAKTSGKNTVRFFDQEFDYQKQEESRIEKSIIAALKNNKFRLQFQPRIDLRTMRVVSAEVFLRLRVSNKSIPPNDFIPVAEERSLIMELDRWVLSQACEQLSRWKHTIFSQISLSVNISAITMRDDVTETCQSLLESHNLGPRMLGLEVAEGALKTDDVESRRSFDRIHNYGVPIAVDDYGTGSSSLSYLSDFPFSLILVDGSLVAKVPDDSQACALTDALLHMANNLNIVAVAECVETEQQLEFMVNHRCDQAQGYYFTEPLDILKFEKWVRAYQGMPEFEASAVLLFDSSNSGPSPPGAYRSH